MTYSLRQAASNPTKRTATIYDVLLDGGRVGRLERTAASVRGNTSCRIVLDPPLKPSERPSPFVEDEHRFLSFGQAVSWLGIGR